MIISGGVNIYPQEIENQLICHDAVADAAVFGVPDPDLGETVLAVVQLRDPAADEVALRAEILAFLGTSLSRVKLPKRIDFVERLPRTETGKLRKKELAMAYRTPA